MIVIMLVGTNNTTTESQLVHFRFLSALNKTNGIV